MPAKKITQHVVIEETTEDIGPPLSHLKSHFKSIQDWLSNICNSETPQKYSEKYGFGLFETKSDNFLFLIGLSKNGNKEIIDYKPQNMYFLLSNFEFKNLNRKELVANIKTQLIDFTKTNKFEISFLSHSNSIVFNGSILIWSK